LCASTGSFAGAGKSSWTALERSTRRGHALAVLLTNWKTAAVAAICSAAKFPGDKTNSRLSALSPLSIPEYNRATATTSRLVHLNLEECHHQEEVLRSHHQEEVLRSHLVHQEALEVTALDHLSLVVPVVTVPVPINQLILEDHLVDHPIQEDLLVDHPIQEDPLANHPIQEDLLVPVLVVLVRQANSHLK